MDRRRFLRRLGGAALAGAVGVQLAPAGAPLPAGPIAPLAGNAYPLSKTGHLWVATMTVRNDGRIGLGCTDLESF